MNFDRSVCESISTPYDPMLHHQNDGDRASQLNSVSQKPSLGKSPYFLKPRGVHYTHQMLRLGISSV